MLVSGKKREFLAGTYAYAGDDGRLVELNDFLGIKNLDFNLFLAAMGRHPTFASAVVRSNPRGLNIQQQRPYFNKHDAIIHLSSREYIGNEQSSSLQPPYHTLTPDSLYTCIRVVLKLVNQLDSNVVFSRAVFIT